MITDAQIHLWTNNQAPSHHRQSPYDAESAIADMRQNGIDRAINCPAIWDERSNDYADQAAALYPDRFATMGWFALDINPDRPMMEQRLTKAGFLGFRFVFFRPSDCEALIDGRLDWIWETAHDLCLPISFGITPELLGHVGLVAQRYPAMRVMIDHMAVGPFTKLPDAKGHLDDLIILSRQSNVALKVTAVPSMALDAYPFPSVNDFLKSNFDAYGPDRFFWGTDITRMPCSWRDCADMFLQHLPWLSRSDADRVMSGGVSDWVGWT